MKKIVLFSLIALGTVFQYCSSAKKAQAAPDAVTYTANVQPIIQSSCSPCHIPPQGKKEPLHTYDAAKTNIDAIIAAINKNPGEKGFMPFKHPKLPDSTISVFVRWKESGMLEK